MWNQLMSSWRPWGILVVLAIAAIASVVWSVLRYRCSHCGLWRALEEVDRKTMADGSVVIRFQCRSCGKHAWKDPEPVHRPSVYDQYYD